MQPMQPIPPIQDDLFLELQNLIGQDLLITLDEDQLNILGQTFRPVFVGRVAAVNQGALTLDPVIIKMVTAPFFVFPTPLCFPLEKIIGVTPFNRDEIFPLT